MKIFKHSVAKIRNSDGKFEGIPALTGENVYEMAVRNGYIGTEEEYLAEIISDGWVTGLAEVKNDLSALSDSHDELATDVDGVKSNIDALSDSHDMLETAITPQILTGILSADSWAEVAGAYEYTLSLQGLVENPISLLVDINLSDVTDIAVMVEINDAWGSILKCYVSSAGNLTFIFSEIPSIDIPVKVEAINGKTT